jgi:hypothetical protein
MPSSYFLLLAMISTVAHAAAQFGLQSNGDNDMASSFASGMTYDPSIDRIYITGSSYGGYFDRQYAYETTLSDRDCFVGMLQLPQDTTNEPIWLMRQSFGEENVLESCTSIQMSKRGPNNGREFYVLGSSVQSPSVLDGLQSVLKNDSISTYGMILDLDGGINVQGGYIQDADATTYPIAITSIGGQDSNDIVVASIHAPNNSKGSSYDAWIHGQKTIQPDPDIFIPFGPGKWTIGFSASLTRFTSATPNSSSIANGIDPKKTLEPVWEKNLSETLPGKGIFVSDVIQVTENSLLVTGFTMGAVNSTTNNTESFLSSLDPNTGDVQLSVQLQASQKTQNERTYGLCGHNGTNETVGYVVGTTDDQMASGTVDKHALKHSNAFLFKINLDTLEIIWRLSLGALSQNSSAAPNKLGKVFGMACATTPSNEYVYFGGIVKDGATLSSDGVTSLTQSFGKDDIFVAQIDTTNGIIRWITQIGTKENDRLASGRGLLADKDGNALVLGNTRGSLMRQKSAVGQGIGTNDVVIFSLDRDTGEHSSTLNAVTQSVRNYVDTTTQFVNVSNLTVTERPLFSIDAYANLTNNSVSFNSQTTTHAPFFILSTRPPAAIYASAEPNVRVSSLVGIVLLANIIVASCVGYCCVRRRRIRQEKLSEQGSYGPLKLAHVNHKHRAASKDDEYFGLENKSFASGDTLCLTVNCDHHQDTAMQQPMINDWRRDSAFRTHSNMEYDSRSYSSSVASTVESTGSADEQGANERNRGRVRIV